MTREMGPATIVALTVNGVVREVAVDPETPLLYVLRNDLGLLGARFGCGVGECGACTVIVDGRAIRSCDVPVGSLTGPVTTIEALGGTHPLQRALIERQAGQCGYCLSGIVMSAKALLDTTPRPTDEELRTALDGNICRCGSHPRILRALRSADPRMEGRPAPAPGAPARAATLDLDASARGSAPPASDPPSSPFIRAEKDGTVTVFTGKVEIGQGITTALAQIVADELDIPIERVRMATPDTDQSPDEDFTAGSRSIEESGEALRRAAAAMAGNDAPKGPALRRLIGRPLPRLDLPGKTAGAPAFVHDLVLPGMVHGRTVRPPSPAAHLVALDEDEVRRQPGVVAVVRDGSFLGVVAEKEFQAIGARQRARRVATWDERATLPPADPRYLLGLPSEEHVASERADATARSGGTRTLSAEYTRPFIAHGSVGPSCAIAWLREGRYTVWCHSQGIYALRHELAKVLGVRSAAVRVIHLEGAGCYGHNGADDAALDAALLARAVPGRPVRVQWMRSDEFSWEPYGTATVVRLSAALDPDGRIAHWAHEHWGHGHGNRPNPRTPEDVTSLLAARHLARPFRPSVPRPARGLGSGGLRNALPLYRIPSHRIVDHHVEEQPMRVSALRSLGAHPNVFAIESFMDELAAAAGSDPIAFRLAHLDDPRARAVIEAVAERSGWRAGARAADGERGRGVGFARYKNAAAYFACVAEVSLQRDMRVSRVWGAIDTGMAVNPDGVLNQAEGGIVQATSWTLKERIEHDGTRITSHGWDEYATLTFSEAPEVDVALIDRPDEPPLGAGEAFAGPVSAAIANAIYDASGVRLRDLPLTRERLIAAAG